MTLHMRDSLCSTLVAQVSGDKHTTKRVSHATCHSYATWLINLASKLTLTHVRDETDLHETHIWIIHVTHERLMCHTWMRHVMCKWHVTWETRFVVHLSRKNASKLTLLYASNAIYSYHTHLRVHAIHVRHTSNVYETHIHLIHVRHTSKLETYQSHIRVDAIHMRHTSEFTYLSWGHVRDWNLCMRDTTHSFEIHIHSFEIHIQI